MRMTARRILLTLLVVPFLFIATANAQTQPPMVTGFTSGAFGHVGDSVTISGSGFGAIQGTSTVKFSGTSATPTSWSSTSIVVPVPRDATTGNVVVTVGGTSSNAMPFTVAVQATLDSKKHSRTVPDGSDAFPCYARAVNKPKTFNGFWTPKPVNDINKQVTITIGFDTPKPEFPFDCVGEPLEVTVPNQQTVNLVPANWAVGKCIPTLTLTPAVADSPVADVLAIAAKLGTVGLDTQSQYYSLPPLKNKVLAANVVCTLGDGHKLTQSVKITYQNPPRIAVSAGLVASTLGVKSYGIKTIQTGVGSGGVVTTQNSIGVTGPSSAQAIPFGFINLYWSGSRKLNLSTQIGVGVNPNLSSTRVEFFAAPVAISWHDFYFSPGVHIGQYERLTGGFAVGEIVTGLSRAPIIWGYHGGLGFSLSYNLKPLVKAAAPAAPAK